MRINKHVRFIKTKWFIAVACLLLGAAIVLGVRFLTYKPDDVHYHANFAVYINGQREEFKSLKYYEETAAAICTAKPVEEDDNPMSRVHMHDMVSDIVHVEDHRVTWGNFFTVLGWGVGDNYISTGNQIYSPNANDKLTFTLNGKKVDSIANLVISDQDKLLVNYGPQTSSQVQKEYAGIQNKAQKEDQEQDPAGCSGQHETTMRERAMHMF